MNLISFEQNIVIFGAKGMVGSAILRCLKKNAYSKILTPSKEELNLLDNYQVKEWFNQNKPDIVILAAARVGGIYANNKFPADFILENLNYKNNFSFSLISISYGLYGFGYVILGTFISAMARETSGLEATEMYVWLLVGLAGIPMVIFWPWFGKKIGNDLALFFACAIMGLGVLMPVLLENKVGITSASILLGSTFIPITALALLEGQSRYNGSIRVSTAILTSSFSVGQMIGPYFGGVIIDLFNSYSIALTISSISLFIASILMINPTRLLNRNFRDIL